MGRPSVSTVAQEGRDTVRPSQTHSQTRSAATPRAKGCPRRIPPRGNRPKPAEVGKADIDTKSTPGLRAAEPGDRSLPQSSGSMHLDPQADFFNTIGPEPTLRRTVASSDCGGQAEVAAPPISAACSRI